MTGRKSSRGAAVVLAGCVGMAVMAPGLALASAPVVPEVCASGQTLTTAGVCEAVPTSTATPPVETPETSETSEIPVLPAVPALPLPETVPSGDEPTGTDALVPGTTEPDATETEDDSTSAGNNSSVVETGSAQLNALLPSGATTAALPALPLPGFESAALPTPDLPGGGFSNPQDACTAFVGGLDFTGVDPTTLPGLGTQFAAFCASLPTSFDPSGLGGLTDLIDSLTELLQNLPGLPSTPGNGTGTVTEVPLSMPAAYQSYYRTPGFDVDCADVSYAQAQEMLSFDSSDTYRLDADNDGIACEAFANSGQGTLGYPVGGVSTGDGSTDTAEVSPAALALAGTGVGGLALAGMTLVRRFGRES